MSVHRDKLLSALGISRRAGKLQIGFDAAAEAAQSGAPMVVLASDIAERTKRNITQCCGPRTKIVELERTQHEIEAVVGRRFVVAAITDSNFAALVEQAMAGNV